MKQWSKIFLIISGVAAIVLLAGILLQQPLLYKPFALITAISLAIMDWVRAIIKRISVYGMDHKCSGCRNDLS
jgi:hypothetical protein